MEFLYSGMSDIGNVRSNNEDYIFAGKIRDNEYLFIVADGMGGHQAGEVASRKAVNTFVEHLKGGIGEDIPRNLEQIMSDVNEAVMQEGRDSPGKRGMGTTLSVLYVSNDTGYIVHVGDSRIYHYLDTLSGDDSGDGQPCGKHLVILTEDHSFVGRLLKGGFITEEEARVHPQRNVLYQSVGLRSPINVQSVGPIDVKPGETFLLCSDGLYGVVTDPEIETIINGRPADEAARELIKKAREKGGPDNISAVIAIAQEDDPDDCCDAMADTAKIIPPPHIFKNTARRNRRLLIYLAVSILIILLVVYLLNR